MANVFLIGLERKAAAAIANAASVAHHTVFDRPHSIAAHELSRAGIVFAGGTPQVQLFFLRRVRRFFPTLPVVAVVKEMLDPGDLMSALDGGATSCCCWPTTQRRIQRFMEALAPTYLDNPK